jgi:hypothetical protein
VAEWSKAAVLKNEATTSETTEAREKGSIVDPRSTGIERIEGVATQSWPNGGAAELEREATIELPRTRSDSGGNGAPRVHASERKDVAAAPSEGGLRSVEDALAFRPS